MLLRLLKIVLLLAVLNTAYLSWRFVALHAGLTEIGTGICSITETIDCDKVLTTNEARAFYVPNALLGFGFFFGCFLWVTLGFRLKQEYHHHIIRTLAFWLFIATLFTFWFFRLLIRLDALCPLCPWNHLLTYIALGLSIALWLKTPNPIAKHSAKPLVTLVAICVLQFFLWLILWWIAHSRGLI